MVNRLDGGGPRADDRVHVRLELPAAQLSFQTPPADCHLRAMEVRGVWVVYLWSSDGDRDELLTWIQKHGDFDLRTSSPAGRVMALETGTLPPAWVKLFGRFDVHAVVLRRSGSAHLSLQGQREDVERLLEGLGDNIDVERVSHAASGPDLSNEDPLTDTERNAVLAAYKSGYFSVPRDIRLKDLAEEMDRSSGAMSTLLRRGVERLVAAYARDQLDGPAFPVGSQPEAEEATAEETPETT